MARHRYQQGVGRITCVQNLPTNFLEQHMASSSFSRRVGFFLVVTLALIAIFLCVLVWMQYLRPPKETPHPTPITQIPTNSPSATLPIATTAPPSDPSPPSSSENVTLNNSLNAGMYVGYDQSKFSGNTLVYARGSHLFVPWRLVEDGPRGYYDWESIDAFLKALAPGKKAILRIVLRCQDVPAKNGKRDACAPSWALRYDPIIEKNAPCDAPTVRLNYLNPVVRQGLMDFIQTLGERYREDDRIAAVEIGVGFAGEPVPWPYTHTVCDRFQQEEAYRSRPEYADPGKAWAAYHKQIISAYAKAFQGKKALTTIINAAYAERYRADIVRHAVSLGVGLTTTSLHSDDNANRGSANYLCYWGFITEPGFDNVSKKANAAYLTPWAPLIVNKERVPIGMEFNNRYDNTGRIPPEGEAFTRWSILNALDKGADYILPFNDGKGFPGNVRYQEAWRFFNRYAGHTASTTPDVWIAFRSPWKEGAWCPDVFDYSWYLTSELETITYADATSQALVNAIDEATGVFNIGPQDDWRYYYARSTADSWPVFNLDINDAFLTKGDNQVDIIVTYLDHDKGGQWALYYDSASGEKLAGAVELTGSNTWKTHIFHVEDARFGNGLKPLSRASRAQGFDLRLDRADDIDDIFHMVQVIPIAKAPTPQPTEEPVLLPPSPTSTPVPQIQTIHLQQGKNGFQGFTDTYLSQWQPNRRFDKKTVLALRINDVMISLLKVDLRQIPPGSHIINATLHLQRVDPRTPTVRVFAYELYRDWDANATYLRATKQTRWQKPGALGVLDASSTPINDAPAIVSQRGVAEFDLTQLVQKWVDDPASNYGIVLRAKSDKNKQYSFGSSNARKLPLRPYLEIEFTTKD